MKKKILRVLLAICGLNAFTACYGMPPGDWPEPIPQEDLPGDIQDTLTKGMDDTDPSTYHYSEEI